jgi:hypothetical protein
MPRSKGVAALLLAMAAMGCGSKPRVGDPSTAKSNVVAPGQEFELGPGQSALVGPEPLKITFEAVTADSRCPPDVSCVWEGDAVAKIHAAAGTQAAVPYDLHTHAGFATQVDHGGYRIRLTAVSPYPQTAGVPIDPGAYVVTLLVTRP